MLIIDIANEFYSFAPSFSESVGSLLAYTYWPTALILPVLIIKYVSEIDVTLPKWYFPASLILVLYIIFAIGIYAPYVEFFGNPFEIEANMEPGVIYDIPEPSAIDILIVMPSVVFVYAVWWIGALALIRAEIPQNRNFNRTFVIFLQFFYLLICFYFIYRRFGRLSRIENEDII